MEIIESNCHTMSSNVFQRNWDAPQPTGHVTIPEVYTTIAEDAFWGCEGLTSITFPDSLTEIRESAFWRCHGLTSITFLDSLTQIGGDAFEDCINLETVILPSSLLNRYHEMFTRWVPHTQIVTALMWKQHHQRPSAVADLVLYFMMACQRVDLPQELVDIILGYVQTDYMLCSKS